MNNQKLIVTALALVMAGCSGVKEQVGLTKSSPDEFAVVKRAPLSMPPDYRLPAPTPGAARPQEQTTAQLAKQTVFGTVQPDATAPKGAEAALLARTGANSADPAIRQKVDAETAQIAKENVPVVKKILGKGDTPEDAPASVVNAKEEAERLKQNQAQGRPATAGRTPTVEQ